MALHRVRLDSPSGGRLRKTSNEDDEMGSEKQRLDIIEVMWLICVLVIRDVVSVIQLSKSTHVAHALATTCFHESTKATRQRQSNPSPPTGGQMEKERHDRWRNSQPSQSLYLVKPNHNSHNHGTILKRRYRSRIRKSSTEKWSALDWRSNSDTTKWKVDQFAIDWSFVFRIHKAHNSIWQRRYYSGML